MPSLCCRPKTRNNLLAVLTFWKVGVKPSWVSYLDKFKQETLRVVTITMSAPPWLHFENFIIFGGLYVTQSNIFDVDFIAKIVSR